MEVIRPKPAFEDERGSIIDLLQNEEINAVTLITFKKGAVRGNHYHRHTVQWNYVISGSIKLVSQTPGAEVVETVVGTGELVVTEANVKHALVGLEETTLMVFTKGPRGGKEYETDTYRLDIPLVTGTRT